MPPAKRTSSSSSQSSSSSKPASSRSRSGSASTRSAAAGGAKATGTSARKATGRAATQAKSGATKTRKTAKAGAAKTSRASRSGGAGATAKRAASESASTAKSARSGAKGTATAAAGGVKDAQTTARRAATQTTRAASSSDAAKELASRTAKSRDLVMLTRDRIQETLDDAASRGRVTRKDANELAAELFRRGRQQSDELVGDLETLLERGRGQIESATRRARKVDSVDRLVRGADRARRAAGVGPSFPILGYDDLNASQVQSRLKELSRPELRKVLNYERKNDNRKTVVGAIEKSLS